MKLIRALLPLCVVLLLVPAALGSDNFEGKMNITMVMDSKSNDKQNTQQVTYQMKDGYLRMDINVKGFGGMIMNTNTKTMYILMPEQKMYMENLFTPSADQQAEAAAKARQANVKITNTGEHETICGYDCQKFIVISDKNTTQIWLAAKIKGFAGMMNGRNVRGGQPVPEAWEELAKNGGFPLRIITSDDKGGGLRWDVTTISAQAEPDSLFQVPAGYQKFDMAGMMKALQQAGHAPSGN